MKFPLILLTLVACLAIGATGHADEAEAKAILEESNISGGLVGLVGIGDGAFAAALAESGSSLVVHGLDADPDRVTAARSLFRESEAATRLSADLWTGEQLPYAENLVNLLVIAEGSPVDDAETMRHRSPAEGAKLSLRKTATLS